MALERIVKKVAQAGLDRRSFVKDSALGLGALAAGVAAGRTALAADAKSGAGSDAADASAAEDGMVSASGAGDAAEGAAEPRTVADDPIDFTPEGEAVPTTRVVPDASAWLGEEPEVAEADVVATYDTDILIVGAGCAGSAAAATAAEMGLHAIVVERGASVPETREYLGAVNSRFMREAGAPAVDPEKVLNEISRYASGKADRDLIKLWVDNSAEVVEWIDKTMTAAGKSVLLDIHENHPTGGTDYYLPIVQHSWEPSYTYPMRNDLFAQASQDAGNPVLYNCSLVRLVREGRVVTGAICDYEGSLIRINAQRTIIATGGYAANAQMMSALQPDAVAVTTTESYHGLDDGSGIRAALWAGASKQSDPTPILFDRGAVVPGQDAGFEACADGAYRFPGKNYQLNIGSQPFMKVNRHGVRFANESTPYDNMLFATRRQPGGVFCQVFDGNAAKDIARFSMIGCASYTTGIVASGAMSVEEFIQFDGGSSTFAKADTLDELADKLGFAGADKEAFLKSCDEYNALYDAQDDTAYGKEDYRLSELREPPFYGCWFGASLLGTLDGLHINARMQVLDADWQPIPGLYAAGDASGDFFDTNYPEYIPGLACCRSVTEGRYAVKYIAEEPDFTPSSANAAVDTPAEAPAASALTDGTFSGTARGMNGDLTVTIEVKGGAFTVKEIGPDYETPRYPGYMGIEGGVFKEQIETAQSDQIDGIAGASVTTGAIKLALKRAMQASAAAK